MNKCKNCLNTGCLNEVKDYKYQFEESDQIRKIDVFVCSLCGCLHHESDVESFFEFEAGSSNIDTSKAISGWAMSHNDK